MNALSQPYAVDVPGGTGHRPVWTGYQPGQGVSAKTHCLVLLRALRNSAASCRRERAGGPFHPEPTESFRLRVGPPSPRLGELCSDAEALPAAPGEGARGRSHELFESHFPRLSHAAILADLSDTTNAAFSAQVFQTVPSALPLLGERAGVRAVVRSSARASFP